MSQPKPPHRFAALLRIFIVFVVTFDLAFVGQKMSGAHESEFGAHPDEAAHCVTGLLARDAMVAGLGYARGGFQGSPTAFARSFAEKFYLHYPKVAMGVWPPAFHTAQALWSFPFGVSRLSLLLLMAALAAATATLLFEVIWRRFGYWAASVATLVWLCAPLVQVHTGLLMAEMLSTLTMFAATLMWARYLETAGARDAVWFALLTSAAILTKGTGLALVVMCVLSVIVLRKRNVVARPSLWAAAVIIVVLAGIWTWHFRHEGVRVGGWEGDFGWAFSKAAVPFYLKAIASSVAFVVAGLACVGFVARRSADATTLALGSLVLGVLVFQSLIPVGREARHILPVTPALVVLALVGAFALARHSMNLAENGALQQRREHLWVLLVALLSLPQALLAFPQKSFAGFGPLAVEVLDAAPSGARILVCSDASGEGMFISELALRDERPNLIVERASKTLVDPHARDWAGRNQRERFFDDAALLNYIVRSKIAYVVLDAAIPEDRRAGYHDQLKRLIADQTGTFWPVAESPIRRRGFDLFPPLRLYRVVRDLQPGDSTLKPFRQE